VGPKIYQALLTEGFFVVVMTDEMAQMTQATTEDCVAFFEKNTLPNKWLLSLTTEGQGYHQFGASKNAEAFIINLPKTGCLNRTEASHNLSADCFRQSVSLA